MNRVSGLDRLSQMCFIEPHDWSLILGRLLLLGIGVLLAVMPLTERLLVSDHFLHGGQDLELSLLAIAAVFCLIIVLCEHCKVALALVLSSRHLLSLLPGRRAAMCFIGRPADLPLAGSTALLKSCRPLLI